MWITLCKKEKDYSVRELRALREKYLGLSAAATLAGKDSFNHDCTVWDIETELTARGYRF
jgi:hypothetical protein